MYGQSKSARWLGSCDMPSALIQIDLTTRPEDNFSIYRLYTSKSKAEAMKASVDFTENWKRPCKAEKIHEKELEFQGCTTRLGHYVH